jgi:hypothetical protein
VIERNGSDCKYVEIFTHRVSSIDAPSRRTVFIRGRNSKQWEVPKIAGRNTEANISQKGSAGFKTTIDLNKKSATRCVSVYVKIVGNSISIWNKGEETIKTDGRNLLLDALKLIGISRSEMMMMMILIINLPTPSCGCEAYCFALREEYRLTAFDNTVLRTMHTHETEDVIGEWRKFHNEKFHNSYSSSNLISRAKWRNQRWVDM